MANSSLPYSPLIVGLVAELTRGNSQCIHDFWDTVQKAGTPIVETIPDDNENVLVTFLWRAKEMYENVVLVLGPAGLDFAHNTLSHIDSTDIWYKTYVLKKDARFFYKFSFNESLHCSVGTPSEEKWVVDPLNKYPFPTPENPFASSIGLTNAPRSWATVERDDVPKGKLTVSQFHSNILNNDRNIWIYTPAVQRHSVQKSHGLLIVFDGEAYRDWIPTPTILDNLASRGIHPKTAVLIGNVGWERNRELPCFSPFIEFVTDELIPWVREQFEVTSDREETFVCGSSYGGLAAVYAGLLRPDVFGNVISQSGSFYWSPDGDSEPEWQRGNLPHTRSPLTYDFILRQD